MSDRAKAASDRIREHVPILEVLVTYGYRVRADSGEREQQFQCDLHGTGRDNKPSARVYPESNSWYCFACDKTRDAIETVKAKEGVKFWEAVKLLETAYGLDPLPVDYGYDNQEGAIRAIDSKFDASVSFAQYKEKIHKFLDSQTQQATNPGRPVPGVAVIAHYLTQDQLLHYWEKFDEIVHHVEGDKGEGGQWPQDRGRAFLHRLLTTAQKALKEGQ